MIKVFQFSECFNILCNFAYKNIARMFLLKNKTSTFFSSKTFKRNYTAYKRFLPNRWKDFVQSCFLCFHTKQMNKDCLVGVWGDLPSRACRGWEACQKPWGCWACLVDVRAGVRAWSHSWELRHQSYCGWSQSFHGPGNYCLMHKTEKSNEEQWPQRCTNKELERASPPAKSLRA